MELWTKETEKSFFDKNLRNSESIKQLFYSQDSRNVAYWQKNYNGKKYTLQNRNGIIGKFTEEWVRDVIEEVVKDMGLFAVRGAVCEELSLPPKSAADVVIGRKNEHILKAEDIVVIMEVKMSIVWNWEYTDNSVKCIGDFTTHRGNPGLLRSDSVLKAIGKSMNIRISSDEAKQVPILVIGNSPIKKTYHKKVDKLKNAGIIQGFWSINPFPCTDINNRLNIKETTDQGFVRIDSFAELKERIKVLINSPLTYFSGMKTPNELGNIIEQADIETTYEKKGEKFLQLLSGSNT